MITSKSFPAKEWALWGWIPRIALVGAVAVAMAAGLDNHAYGQEKQPNAKDSKKPSFDDLTLTTKDGLQLAVTYYPGAKGKQSIPVVLLHEYKESRVNYASLATALQSAGYAVIAVDLRGHGGSMKYIDSDDKIEATKMAPSQYPLMVSQDMKAVKDFLWKKNNEGELNIDKLCVIGAEMGALVALDFAAYDADGYDNKAPYYGKLKLGRFVKMLVLISPKWSFKRLTLNRAVRNPIVQNDIAMLILVGKQDSKAMGEATQVYKRFEKFHPEPSGDDKIDKQTLVMLLLDTNLQGTKLLDPTSGIRIELFSQEGNKKFAPGIAAQDLIADFIRRRLVKSPQAKDWEWAERKYPHE